VSVGAAADTAAAAARFAAAAARLPMYIYLLQLLQ